MTTPATAPQPDAPRPGQSDVTAATLELMTQLVDAHRGLVELVAALQDDVLCLVETHDRSPAAAREDASTLRAEAAQVTQQAQRLIARAEGLAPRPVHGAPAGAA